MWDRVRIENIDFFFSLERVYLDNYKIDNCNILTYWLNKEIQIKIQANFDAFCFSMFFNSILLLFHKCASRLYSMFVYSIFLTISIIVYWPGKPGLGEGILNACDPGTWFPWILVNFIGNLIKIGRSGS